MTIGTWLILAGFCLFYGGLGLWAVSRIFPGDHTVKRSSDPDQQRKGLGHEHARS